MTNQGYHSITSCNWDTTLDSKTLAHEFQTTISNWSKYHMQREINQVFDRICPKGQTIKIQQLELNLGVIAYEDFLHELPELLKTQLELQLRDLIMYPKNGNKAIEVIPEAELQINIIRDFLLQGVLQWNYLPTYGSIHNIMNFQLTQNKWDVIKMLKIIGAKETVRQRIAWQFKTYTIQQIIKGLEPNNYEKIIAFSDEMIKIQEKQPVVQSSTKELRKNIWFWVLNYLFDERGTLFNTIAFFRSNLQQMANHFNLTLEALLELIDETLEKVTINKHVEKGFILVLKTIIKDLDKVTYPKAVTQKQKENFWKKLANYIANPSLRSKASEKQVFNELVINLSKEQPQRFQKLCVDIKPTQWSSIIKDLTPEAIEALFIVIAPRQHVEIIQNITFLAALNINISKQQLYNYGIDYVFSKPSISFLSYNIEKLSKRGKYSKISILEKLTNTQVPLAYRQAKYITIHNTIKTHYTTEVKSVTFSPITILQSLLYTKTKRLNFDDTIESTLKKCFENGPKESWTFLKSHSNSTEITHEISTTTITHILKQTHKAYIAIVEKIEAAITQLTKEATKNTSVLNAIKQHLYTATFKILWHYKKPSTSTFLIQLLQELKYSLTHINSNDFEHCIQSILTHKRTNAIGLPQKIVDDLKIKSQNIAKRNTYEVLQFLILKENTAQHKVAAIIAKHSHNKTLETSEFKTLAPQLIAYFLGKNSAFQEKLIKDFSAKVAQVYPHVRRSQIQDKIRVIFWQIIADYKAYRGNESVFVRAFKKAIDYSFPDVLKVTKPQTPSDKQIQISPHYEFSKSQLVEAITKAILELEADCVIANVTYQFKTILSLALEVATTDLLKIIISKVTTAKQLKHLQNAIAFEAFIVIMAHNAPKANQQIFEALKTLFYILKTVEPKLLTKATYTKFWKSTLELLQSKQNTINTLAAFVFKNIADQEHLDSNTVLKVLQKNAIKIPILLKIQLATEYRLFEWLPEQPKAFIEADIKTAIAKQQLEALCKALLLQNAIPSWFYHQKPYEASTLLNTLLRTKPLVFINVFRVEKLSKKQWKNLENSVMFSDIIEVLENLYPLQHQQLANVKALYACLPYVTINGVTTMYLQQVLFQKVLKAWSTNHWKLIDSTTIWNELLWEICTKKGIAKTLFFKGFEAIRAVLPKPLQITLQHINPKAQRLQSPKVNIKTKTKMTHTINKDSTTVFREGVSVPNAGLVLLNTYFLMLFDRLEIIENEAFKSSKDQINAIHYLQYIVTGQSQTEESLLALNKLLCGVELSTPITEGMDISDSDKTLIEGLIKAAIQYWSSIGDTSINGFRGNWLVRNGLLREEEERWELTIEKRAYDILLNQSPFSFSIIKLPWMPKPLHVTWPY